MFFIHPQLRFLVCDEDCSLMDHQCNYNIKMRTWCEDLLRAGVGGEHLTHELPLLLPVVVLQVVHQHHISGLLHRHYLAEHLQLQQRGHNNNKTMSAQSDHADAPAVTLRKTAMSQTDGPQSRQES